MKLLLVFLALGSLSSSSLQASPATEAREYSFMTAKPYRIEVQRGQQRLAKFLAHLDPKRRALLDQTPYVAVQVYTLSAGEIFGLTTRLGKGSVTSSQFDQDIRSGSQVQVKFLVIYDARTQQMVGDEGVLVTDTPPRYTVGTFEGTRALYVGQG